MTSALYHQDHFRVRSGDTVGLNADSGWAAVEDEDSGFYIYLGMPFRIRFKIRESNDKGSANTDVHLQVRHAQGNNDWVDVRAQSQPDGLCPPAIMYPSTQYTDAAVIDTELLTGTALDWVNGEGDTNNVTNVDVDDTETELEFCLFPNRWYEKTLNNHEEVEAGDTLEFRVVLGVIGSSTAFTGTYNIPVLTVASTDKYLGGTFAETPGRVFWVDDDKNLYAMIEACETHPRLIMMKSSDGGDTWTGQDIANGPTHGDMEGYDGVLENDRIYMAHQESGDDVEYHVFRVSTHSTNPDTWETIDTDIATAVAMNSNPQTVAIVRRSDGDRVLFYVRDNGTIDSAYYKIEEGSGWGSEQTLDAEASHFCKGIVAVLGASDKIHIFYRMVQDTVAGEIYHRSLDSSNTLSGRESIDDTGSSEGSRFQFATPPVYWDDSGDEKIMCVYFDDNDAYLKSVVVTNDGTPESPKTVSGTTVLEDAGSSADHVHAFSGNNGSTVYVVYADATTQDLWYDYSTNDGGWTTDTEILDGIEIDYGPRGQYFQHSSGNGSAQVLGYIYDSDSNGGTGRIWYNEYVLSAGMSQVYKDLALQWDIAELVYKDLLAQWDILGLVYKDQQFVWDILNLVNKDQIFQWDIAELVYKDLTLQWDMSGQVYKDQTFQWDILNLVNKDLTAIWDILNLVYKDQQFQWDILNLVYKDATFQWDMSGSVNKDLTAQWDIFNTVNKDQQFQWDILSLVYKDMTLQWDISELVYKDLTAQWDMAGIVNKDLTAQWDIYELVNKDVTAQWDIFNLVNKDQQFQWDIYSLVYKDQTFQWDIESSATAVNKDLALQWDILNLVNKDQQFQWDILNLVNKDLTAQWDILVLVNKDLTAQWDIAELVNKDLTVQYDIAGLVYKDQTFQWDMAGTVNKDLTLEWDILSIGGGRNLILVHVRTVIDEPEK